MDHSDDSSAHESDFSVESDDDDIPTDQPRSIEALDGGAVAALAALDDDGLAEQVWDCYDGLALAASGGSAAAAAVAARVRGALSARQRLIDHKQAVDKELAHVHDEIVKLDDDTAKLKAKLADARQRQKSIILRQQSVSSRLKVKTQINDNKMTDAMLRMEQYEGKIDRMEAELEAYDLGTRTVSDQFAQLESDDKVEAELAKLRSKFGKGEAPAAGPETDDSANR